MFACKWIAPWWPLPTELCAEQCLSGAAVHVPGSVMWQHIRPWIQMLSSVLLGHRFGYAIRSHGIKRPCAAMHIIDMHVSQMARVLHLS